MKTVELIFREINMEPNRQFGQKNRATKCQSKLIQTK